jgi:SPP1 gp7 family putative phage head morphogenesis protein
MALPEPEIIRAMTRFRRLVLARDEATLRTLTARWAQLERALEAAIEGLAQEATLRAARGEPVSLDMMRRWGRYERLMSQLQAETLRYADAATMVIGAEQRELLALGIEHAVASILALEPGIAGAFDVLPVAAFENMVGLVSDGSPLRTYLQQVYPQAAQAMMDALVKGIGLGWGARKTAGAMREEAALGLRSAMNTARTETLRAYRAATLAQYAQTGIVEGYRRLAAKSTRTCPACLMMDGEWFPLSTPFEEHVCGRCLTPGTVVSALGAVGFVTRYYQGYVITIRTAAGKLLTVTPNHPILTQRGWVRADLLREGDNVIGNDLAELSTASVPDKYHMPTLVEEIPGALGMVKLPSVMPASAQDFHGDGKGSEVYVVWADRLLRDHFETTLRQPYAQGGFGGRGVGGVGLTSSSYMATMGKGLRTAPRKILSDGDTPVMFCDGGTLGKQTIGGRLVTQCDACKVKASSDSRSGNVIGAGHGIFGFASQVARDELILRDGEFGPVGGSRLGGADDIASGLIAKEAAGFELSGEFGTGSMKSFGCDLGAFAGHISLDRILEVSRSSFAGHVYNLQTVDGWYSANGIVTHNCTMVPTIRGREASRSWTTGREWFEAQAPDTQQGILGPGLFNAWQAGEIGLNDIPVLHEDPTWGNSWQIISLKQARRER